VNVKALKAALDPVRKQNTVIALSIEDGGKTIKALSALVKDYQIDPIRRDITHVDLLAIDPNKEVTAVVPLEFTGKPAGVINGGLLHTVMRSLAVKCKPADIPVKLELDISPLDIGDVLHVSDVQLPGRREGRDAGREAVISMVAPEKETAGRGGSDAAAAAAPAAGKDAKAAPAAAGKDAKAAPAAAGKAAAPAAKPAAKK
jgi:large subunit ribosomal protein L25